MRSNIIEYCRDIKSRNFSVSDELPFTSGQVLYLKNLKRVYVDRAQSSQEQIIAVIGNHGVFQEVSSITAYLATDAKNLPADYDSYVNQIKLARNIDNGEPYFRREVDVSTTFEGDYMITQFDFRFVKLI